jgi:Flp pilus assembly protein TadD/peroxiredoxin
MTAENSGSTKPAPASNGTWMVDPIQIPSPSLKDANGTLHKLNEWKGSAVLLPFASPSCEQSTKFLIELEHGQAQWKAAGVSVVAIVMNAEQGRGNLPADLSYPLLLADERASNVFNLFRRYLFDRRRDMPVPSAFLLDGEGRLVRVYDGFVSPAELVADCSQIPHSAEACLKLGLPFAGRCYNGELHHNYFNYGVVYLQHEYYDEAQAAFEQSIQLSPNNPTAYYDLGLIALNKGQFAEARSRLENAVHLDPANADAWNNLGVVMGQLGEQDEARRDFQRALERQPAHAMAVQNMIKLLRYQNRPQEVRAVLLKAIEADPRQAELHNELGRSLVEGGDLDGARAEFEKAVDLEPSNPEMLNDLGVVLMQKGDNDHALQVFEKCAHVAPNFGLAVINIAELELAAGDTEKAHAVLSNFLQRNPEDQDVREALKEVDSRR